MCRSPLVTRKGRKEGSNRVVKWIIGWAARREKLLHAEGERSASHTERICTRRVVMKLPRMRLKRDTYYKASERWLCSYYRDPNGCINLIATLSCGERAGASHPLARLNAQKININASRGAPPLCIAAAAVGLCARGALIICLLLSSSVVLGIAAVCTQYIKDCTQGPLIYSPNPVQVEISLNTLNLNTAMAYSSKVTRYCE